MAKYLNKGCPQRDSVEREEYAGARSIGTREIEEALSWLREYRKEFLNSIRDGEYEPNLV
jgi:hypothetical protein